ncbi:hypothetical protein MBLNU457_1904t1 [Dothideomycetes sp. NU457]
MSTVNISGALIFWSYIVAALTFTGLIIYTILNDGPFNKSGLRSEKITFAALAWVSFLWLSYNMVNVLLRSYLEWETVHKPVIPLRFTFTSCTLSSMDVARRLWHWSTTSTLFEDFGRAIVADRDGGGWTWSRAALQLINIQMMAMAFEAHLFGVPHLWIFFVLAEILPISFTQNLFHLMCLPRAMNRRSRRMTTSWIKMLPFGAYTGAYSLCLDYAPRSGSRLMTVILAARLLLLSPLFLPSPVEFADSDSGTPRQPADRYHPFYMFAVVAGALIGIVIPMDPSKYYGINYHPAVSTLAYDCIMSVVSSLYWTLVAW